mmetsp:Transcript_28157/g.57112  ORF Transcript_28157/g.57112 Transcript_28157/m.57112 type:complete len:142 (-) Transcript_28157:1032-1457(-)
MALPGFIVEGVKLSYGGDALFEGFKNVDLAMNWKWAEPGREMEPFDIMAVVSFGLFCLVGCEILLRTLAPKRSFLYWASNNLPPKGKSVPFPGKVRSMQSAMFLMLHISSMICRSVSLNIIGFVLQGMMVMGFTMSCLIHL